MERYKVTGHELREFYKTETSLGRVFMDIERELRDSNQVVCQFVVNGLELKEADEGRFSALSLNEVQTLEYLAENSEVILESVLDSWVSALPELMGKTEELSEKIRAHGLKGHYKAIHDLVENCEYLVGSMVSIKNILGEDLADLSPMWDKAEKCSGPAVKQAIQALQAKDFVQLADILEYDLNHALQVWLDSLVQLGEMFNVAELGKHPAAAKVRANSGSGKRNTH